MEFVLNHTKFGRYTIAIGSNKEAAALSGINVKFYHVMVYVVCGLFVGLAAIAYAAVTPTVQPGTGAGLEMDAIGGGRVYYRAQGIALIGIADFCLQRRSRQVPHNNGGTVFIVIQVFDAAIG